MRGRNLSGTAGIVILVSKILLYLWGELFCCLKERIKEDDTMKQQVKGLDFKLQEMAAVHDNLSVKIAFSNKVAHETEGAADFFLMPSRYEPCGLNQMYSLVYGTLPVAHRTGGLADTIIDITENPKEGTGFLFPDLSLDSILDGVDRALAFFEDKEGMEKAIRNAMRTDFSWDRSASEYIGLYSTLIR